MTRLMAVLALTLFLHALQPTPCAAVLEGFDPFGNGPAYPESASGRSGPKPSLRAHRITEGTIEIDGRLDEADWAAAEAGTGFTQFQPNRQYIREMKRYGIIAESIDPKKDKIDPFETDEKYWQSFWKK